MSTNYGYVRVRKLPFADIGDASRHARGDDAEGRRRDDAGDARAVVAWPAGGADDWRIDIAKRHDKHPANDYVALFKAHKKRHKAQEYGNYPPVRHLIVGVSPNAIGGDGHDPRDERLRKLLCAAVDWAQKEFGGVFAARADVDERGQGEIDVLIAPVRDVQCGRAKTKKAKIVPGRALEEFARRNGGTKRSYSLMQDSWAAFARGRGFDVTRGRSKKETGREHLSPEDYGEAKDTARDQAEHNRQQLAAIEEENREVEAAKERLAAKRKKDEEDLRADREELSRSLAELARRDAALAKAEEANAEEARKLAADRKALEERIARHNERVAEYNNAVRTFKDARKKLAEEKAAIEAEQRTAKSRQEAKEQALADRAAKLRAAIAKHNENVAKLRNREAAIREREDEQAAVGKRQALAGEVLDACMAGGIGSEEARDALFAALNDKPIPDRVQSYFKIEREAKAKRALPKPDQHVVHRRRDGIGY